MTPALFEPFRLRDLTLRNRVAVSPMQTYSAPDALAGAWHRAHLGRFALGGAGLVMVEATAVTPDGRSTAVDLGLWSDDQEAALAALVASVHAGGAAIGLQLQHAGRKAGTAPPWEEFAPVPLAPGQIVHGPDARPASTGGHAPKPLDEAGMTRLIEAYRDAARRADRAGVDMVEIHMAHGYLLHSFLSPLSNGRTDGHGGALDNRLRFPLAVVEAVRAAWPAHKPLACRISAVDGIDIGWTIEESEYLARRLKASGVDLIDCSSGGMTLPRKEMLLPRVPGFQVPFAERLREAVAIPTMAVGLITAPRQAEDIIRDDRADLVAIGRQMLVNPNWANDAATALMGTKGYALWPKPFGWWLARRERATHIRS